ncbi:sugar transferase [uncultured Tateyamaria sp.]|uniref:sugar transferase n=1 Tax=Tateyamaria sp. 1078 TaxID=3417464 RepID=UPI00260D8B12|nr:sugar transferase [uncultured Tateyamaria sp.]
MNNRVSTAADTAGLRIGRDSAAPLYPSVFKRLFDVILSVILLPILLPIIAVLYIVVRSDGGPGFFGHSRVGRNGRSFKCWKVRTMVTDAQERLDALLESDPNARAEWDRDRKLRNDPRVTRIGNFLRKSSLDELPQIFNVLKGEMSLVGPRPVTESELERYGTQQGVYLAMRPGVTGLWQVSGRNEVTYGERVSMDSTYYNSVSLGTDLRILAKTADAVLSKTGC